MKIIFFTQADKQTGSSRQRAFYVAKELNARGIESIVVEPSTEEVSRTPWPKKFQLIIKLATALFRTKKEDIIFFERTVYNKYFILLALLYWLIYRRRSVFDLDDAVYLHSRLKTIILIKISKAVIVGSHALLDWAHKFHKKVFLIPTSVNHKVYDNFSINKREENRIVTLGWVGNGKAHYENLKLLVKPFTNLTEDGISFRFILIGSLKSAKVYDLFNKIDKINVEFVDSLDWSDPEAVPKAIQRFDIGLMPLLDNEWERAKCAFKAIEYMAVSVPAIVSGVGENKYLIKDGLNGYIANNSDEWVENLKLLIKNKNLRQQIGQAGQGTIVQEYSLQANIPKLIKIFNKL